VVLQEMVEDAFLVQELVGLASAGFRVGDQAAQFALRGLEIA